MNIGEALRSMRNGKRVQRIGWSDKIMYLCMQIPDDHSKMTLPYIYVTTKHLELVPWTCNQIDLLAVDWVVVE